ncbi:hypothetical protein BX666DRAFT_1876605 [Dichotomocladium elegans]|nr:hypothetical protein BX666DRAFT_1876605 [Dichotomocladium elegans]
MRLRILIILFILLFALAILGFAPVHLHEQFNDKILHFVAFFLLGLCLYFIWGLSYQRNLVFASIILFSMAVMSECIQGLLPYRTFDGYDIASNCFGGTVGLLSAFLVDFFFASRREHRRRWGGKHEAEYQRALMDESDLELNDEIDDENYHHRV